jgi:putative ABC transport system substrate-binding protein
MAAFTKRLQEVGWLEGRNILIDRRWRVFDPDRARDLAAEIIHLGPDVIFVVGEPGIAALRQQANTIPIVLLQSGDPVQSASVRSFARPGGNATGFVLFEPTINAKYLQLLKDVAPDVTRVAVMQFENSTWRGDFSEVQAVARPWR